MVAVGLAFAIVAVMQSGMATTPESLEETIPSSSRTAVSNLEDLEREAGFKVQTPSFVPEGFERSGLAVENPRRRGYSEAGHARMVLSGGRCISLFNADANAPLSRPGRCHYRGIVQDRPLWISLLLPSLQKQAVRSSGLPVEGGWLQLHSHRRVDGGPHGDEAEGGRRFSWVVGRRDCFKLVLEQPLQSPVISVGTPQRRGPSEAKTCTEPCPWCPRIPFELDLWRPLRHGTLPARHRVI
jgi:hypothetical protein